MLFTLIFQLLQLKSISALTGLILIIKPPLRHLHPIIHFIRWVTLTPLSFRQGRGRGKPHSTSFLSSPLLATTLHQAQVSPHASKHASRPSYAGHARPRELCGTEATINFSPHRAVLVRSSHCSVISSYLHLNCEVFNVVENLESEADGMSLRRGPL